MYKIELKDRLLARHVKYSNHFAANFAKNLLHNINYILSELLCLNY